MHWVLPAASPVTRATTAWLVRWFFDRQATFAFVESPAAGSSSVGVAESCPPGPDADGTRPPPPPLTRAEREARAVAWFWLR